MGWGLGELSKVSNLISGNCMLFVLFPNISKPFPRSSPTKAKGGGYRADVSCGG